MVRQTVRIHNTTKRHVPRKAIKELILEALRLHGEPELSADVNVIFVDDSEIRRLNTQFLGRDRPTDVIAFNLSDSPEHLEGEIYVSVDTAQRQAKDYAVTFWNELCRLAVHGALHLLGFDDATDDQKKRMTAEENRVLAALSDEKRGQTRQNSKPTKRKEAR